MKKMVLPIIFIIVLALLVFAGCVSFTTNITDLETTTDEMEEDTGNVYTTEPPTHYEPATDAMGEEITDAEGSQIYVAVTDAPSYYPSDEYTEPGVYTPTSPSDPYQPTTQMNVPTTGSHPGQPEPTTNHGGNDHTNVPTTGRPSDNEPTTKPNNVNPTVNEYDVFRSGTFYARGSMVDSEGSNPLEMAITPDSIYMLTKFESTDMAILVSKGKTYMIYPAGKAYLEMSSVVMNMMGLDTDELISSGDLGFSDMEPLSKAVGTSKATKNGKDCTVYDFNKEDGSVSKVYMAGNKLVAIESVENGKVVSATYIDSITASVPADKTTPSAGYEKKSIFEFMSLLTDVLE